MAPSDRPKGAASSKISSIEEAAAKKPARRKARQRKSQPAAPAKKAAQPTYVADLYSPEPLSPKLVEVVRDVEAELGRPVWLLVQDIESVKNPIDLLHGPLLAKLLEQRRKLPRKKIALVIDSPGGDAHCTYQIATTFRRRCGGYSALVPKWAKSAATLLALGADQLIVGPDAQFGPLDVQYTESRRKPHQSALNEVQILERLHSNAIEAIDQTMLFLSRRLELQAQEMDEFLPPVMDFVAKEFEPLFSKVDVVHWTFMSRLLRVAHDYAVRLLLPKYGQSAAQRIARSLVEAYPGHDFNVDGNELRSIGIETTEPDGKLASLVDDLHDLVGGVSAIGFITEKK